MREKRLIKTLQNKTLLTPGRVEVSPHLGLLANDPSLDRYIADGTAACHSTAVFSMEADFGCSLDPGDTDDPIAVASANELHPPTNLLFQGPSTFFLPP